MTDGTQWDRANRRGFTPSELTICMAFAIFVMGIFIGQFDNGGMIKEMAFVVAGAFAIIAILFALMTRKAEDLKNKTNELKSQQALIILILIFFVLMLGVITYVGDRQSNPTEDYCHNIGTDRNSGAQLGRAVVLQTGQCIKNETGFHANGKAIFP